MGQPGCGCYSNININAGGTLIAGDVSSSERVSFTSLHDDIGGDTDGSDTPPAPGDWRMITVSGILELHHVDVRYGGLATYPGFFFNPDGVRMIVNQDGTVLLDDADISYAYTGAGFTTAFSASTTVQSSRFHDLETDIEQYQGTLAISNTTFSTGLTAIITRGDGALTIASSSFTTTVGVNNQSPSAIADARNNYWGSPTGPTNPANSGGTGATIVGSVLFDPWLNKALGEGCLVNCYSNVLFLPGVAGSRLYQVSELESQRCLTDTGDSYFKRWLPLTDCDNSKLLLNSLGWSQNHIVTKDIIDEAAGIPDIYASFLDDLKKWRDDDNIIADYSTIPYDWRLSVDDVLNKGKVNADGYIDYTQTLPANETPYTMSELLRMASSSRTGKVTIVAHSNGGIITKALMLQLRELGKEDLVDKIILVAVPEIGTPDAVAALLHGSDIGQFGVISDKRQTREISRNMPTAYNLLPSEKYYQTAAATMPMATFDNSGLYSSERSNYGLAIGNFNEMTQYLLGAEGRIVPDYGDLNSAAKANTILLPAAATLHASLDGWTPASTTRIIEVAGVGEYTIAGLQYVSETYCSKSHDETSQFFGTRRICDEYSLKKTLKDVKTINGDFTVVADSAHYLSDKSTPNTEQWWLDLSKHNSIFSPNISRVHKDIFEVASIRDFVKNQIINSTSTISYMSLQRPTINKAAIKYVLHSPLSLNLYDDQGRHTGISTTTNMVEENIPGTRYVEVGDSKEIIADAELAQHLMLIGYASGSFSLGIEKLEGDTIIASTTYSAIPSSTSTVVTLDLPPNVNLGVQGTSSPLKIDFNGDGVVDTQIIARLNQETVYDATPPEVELSFDLSKQTLSIAGNDSVSSTTVATTSTFIKVTDVAGNSTELLLTKYKVKPKKIELVISGIKQNGVIISTSTIPLTYKWNILTVGASTTIKTLASYTKTATSSVETHYRPKKSLTIVMTSPLDLDDNDDGDEIDQRANKEKLLGLRLIKLNTAGGKTYVNY
jgi:pimeloyl-ACP methyl ester carboxylesterase